MVGVNELISEWKGDALDDSGSNDPKDCAEDLEHVAESAWRPVSESPDEADGDKDGYIIVRDKEGGTNIVLIYAIQDKNVAWKLGADFWARIRDVILLPPGEF